MSVPRPRAGRTLFAALLALLLPLAALTAPASADVPGGSVVSDDPANFTPHATNGRVYSIIQVGNTMVLGGTFTRATNAGSSNELTRNRLMAFNANSGQIDTGFTPNVNGTVRVVLPAGDGSTIYVGGSFSSINGQPADGLARVRLSDGSLVQSFDPGSITGQVRDLRLADGRLWAAGAFTHVGGSPQRALATLDPQTGDLTSYMNLDVDGIQNGGVTQVLKIDITPDGNRLVAVGNFRTVNGEEHRQLLMLDLTGANAAVSTFRTDFYAPSCLRFAFDTYMRDVDFSPDGSFFVVTTTGAYGGSTGPCDTSARFETGGVGPDVAPSWVDYTGGDTTYGVEVTPGAVYLGGHFRWQNNAFAGDRPGRGSVSREGIAAVDPVNGLPLSWDPGRTKGVGVFDFLATDQGLWVGSDTDRIGAFEYHGRIALMPAAGGSSYPAQPTPQLPGTLYLGDDSGLDSTRYDGSTATAAVDAPNGPQDWADAQGAFMLNGQVYLARADGSFVRHTFDGGSWGPAVQVDTADQNVAMTDWDGDVQAMTGMFLDQGRIYFTLAGEDRLYYRYFTPESDVVGAKRLVATEALGGIDFRNVRGMFLAGSRMYFADTAGTLRSLQWQQGAASGSPVAGTQQIEQAPGSPVDWTSNAMFVGPDNQTSNAAPTAELQVSCDDLTCTFDGSGSGDSDGTIDSYEWSFGDGNSDTGEVVEHTYTTAGEKNVSLTVTDDGGETDTATGTANPTEPPPNQAPSAALQVSCDDLMCTFDGSGSGDSDGTIASYEWDFGDGNGDTGEVVEHTYTTAGEKDVSLTVTDDGGETDTANGTAEPTEPSTGGGDISLVGAAGYSDRGFTHQVAIPADVQAGDTLLLSAVVNSTNGTLGDPGPGWTVLSSPSGNNIQGRAWTRQATAGDAGSTVEVSTSSVLKVDLKVGAYRGDGGTSEVLDHAAVVDQTDTTSHTSPTVDNPQGGSWLATTWVAKRSSDISWTLPASQTRRVDGLGEGGGRLSGVLSDSDGPVSTGQVGGLQGTTSESVSRTIMFSTVIGADGGGTTPPGNAAPTAELQVSCDDLTCTFDGSGSGDSDGTIASYEWDFGDGNGDTGQVVEHTYPTAGEKDVSLTVTDDDGETDTANGTANPTETGGGGGGTAVDQVASANYNDRGFTHQVTVPGGVQAGDTLLLTAVVNSTNGTLGNPGPGWTVLLSPSGSNIQGRSWTRTATAADAGSTIEVTTSEVLKVDLGLASYRGDGGPLEVLDHSAIVDQSGGTMFTSPTVNNPTAGSWLVTSWVAKKSAALSWSIPAGQARREDGAGAGGGRLTSVLADSGGPLGAGQVGGLQGTVNSDTSRVIMFSTVIGAS